jgi:hypothetical protein
LQNVQKLPLCDLFLNVMKDGVLQKWPALSEKWIEKRIFTKYTPILIQNGRILEDHAATKEWIIETEYVLFLIIRCVLNLNKNYDNSFFRHFNSDLIWILKLDYHRYEMEFKNNLYVISIELKIYFF